MRTKEELLKDIKAELIDIKDYAVSIDVCIGAVENMFKELKKL